MEIDDDEEPHVPFDGVVRRSHGMEPGSVVLVLERYTGDLEVGDEVVLAHEGKEVRVKVVTLAWGSSFRDESPPLTLVVAPLEPGDGYAGATLKGDARPSAHSPR